MPPPLLVRPATPADASAAAACQLEAWRAAYAQIVPAELLQSPALGEDMLRRRLHLYAGPPAVHLVLEAREGSQGGRAVLGFCDAGPLRAYPALRPQVAPPAEVGSTLELWTLYVHPRLRGQGGGKALLAAAAGAASRRFPACNERTVVLTFEANAPARRFYEARGGRLRGILDGYGLWGRAYRVACYGWERAGR